jgi:anhydro-N-acetylmuramic acid kinase
MAVERELTDLHADAVAALLARAGRAADSIDIIGFHGHTILHEPHKRRTWQLGDGARLARATGIDVVCDFRAADVAAGGEGAPLVPIVHAALAHELDKPLAVLNVGGVANVTWIGPERADGTPALLAFDVGPGNALSDDWAMRHTGKPIDADGALAKAGRAHDGVVATYLSHPFFAAPPPKSLDRDAFSLDPVAALSPEDGAATLVAFTAEAVARAMSGFPAPPRRWLVTGGGRLNPALMAVFARRLGAPVEPVEAVGWNGDALEAQAFAVLAVRSLRGLPFSYPETTRAPRPMTGGRLFRARGKALRN